MKTRRWPGFSFTLALLLLPFSPATSLAALEWTTTRVERSASAGDAEVVADFPFKNTTQSSVSILKLQTSCDCTAATASSTTIAPGETGRVRAVFTLGERIGRQHKTVEVTSSDASAEPTTLVLRVNIAEVVTGSPRMHFWKVDETPNANAFDFRPVGSHRILGIDPPTDIPGFWHQFESEPSRNIFRLHLKPLSTAAPSTTVIRLTAHVEGRPPLPVVVYALVK
ncbi:MAG TPA: DUF1573 domain-containing protein [Opitutus sp.]|nr:DUF1573 domain-containing protein [Opitutus sp.]